MEHLLHPNNHIPHFPLHCPGSIDTFPIFVEGGFGRYQPKYSGNVVKFQAGCFLRIFVICSLSAVQQLGPNVQLVCVQGPVSEIEFQHVAQYPIQASA